MNVLTDYYANKNIVAKFYFIVDRIDLLNQAVNEFSARGIEVNKNLAVFTSLPDGKDTINNVDEILRTLVSNYSIILIDCDFGTSIGYFKQSQEVIFPTDGV